MVEKWKRGTWRSSYMGKVSDVESIAHHYGHFVAYKSGKVWLVEHKPTRMGLGFHNGFRLIAEAKRYLEDLQAIPANWQSVDVDDHAVEKLSPEVRTALESAYRKHKSKGG